MSLDLDAVVVGAGVVGIAIARALARAGREVVVLEAERGPGQHTSSRNSEVVHAGLYYPTGSLKARTCVRGRELLHAHCRARGVPVRPIGKLVLAAEPSELGALERLHHLALANGVDDLRTLDRRDLRARAPDLHAIAALHSPRSGIVDSHRFLRSLLDEARDAGALLAFGTPLLRAEVLPSGFRLAIPEDVVTARTLVNAAGLGGWALARAIDGYPLEHLPARHLAKGNYFALSGRVPFDTLVYPLPTPGGLGVHLTLDLAGHARFGPDVEWVDHDTYDVDPARAPSFEHAIRRYWPGLPRGRLRPDYAGIRGKLSGPGEPAADFVVQDATVHGVPGLVHLFGIESPGLTAALALAEEVCARIPA